MDRPRLAIVGMGGYAQAHRRYVQQVEQQELGKQVAQVAIPADQEAFAADLAAMRQRQIMVFGSLREMLAQAREHIDIVCIPTGIPLHRSMTVAALEAGCHVLVEKPAAGSIQDVHAMLNAASRAQRLCAVGYQHIYQREFRRVKDWVCQGRLGAIHRIRAFGCWPRQPGYYARNGWAGRLAVDDTWVLDAPHNNALAHAVNAMLFMASPVPDAALCPAAVRAELYRANDIESADTAAMRVHTVEGPQVFFAVSHCTDRTLNPVFIMEGEKGHLEMTYEGKLQARFKDGTTQVVEVEEGPRRVLEDLAQVVAGERSALMCPLDMARMQTLCACGTFESSAIHPLPQALRTVDPGSGAVVIRGMTEAVQQAWSEGALFSELGIDWAIPGDEIDLTGYTYFPSYRRRVGDAVP